MIGGTPVRGSGTLKILLSAYACSPTEGSEPKVGWHWAIELAAFGHDVWVLTHAHHRRAIESYFAQQPPLSRVRFVYHAGPSALPAVVSRWTEYRADYSLWQWTAYRYARALHARERFDLVHHITWGAIRQPSFMGRLGIPFLLGPLGGGERAPWRLRRGYGLKDHLLDGLRDLSNRLLPLDPLSRASFRRAAKIYVKTPESRRILPKAYQDKTECLLEIGTDIADDGPDRTGMSAVDNGFRVTFIGRFLGWKGMHLGLAAFARLSRHCPSATLSMVGAGPAERRWRAQASTLGVAGAVRWIPWVPYAAMPAIYRSSTVLLFPSLHDSSGNVVLEALSYGVPVICLDLGGPKMIVDDGCGRVIATAGRSADAVVDALAATLIALAADPALRGRLRAGALRRARQLTWRSAVARAYAGIPAAGGAEAAR